MLTRIKNLCKSRNLKIAELERDLGFSNGLISRWANSSPSIDKVTKVADYFDVSLDWLYGRKQYEITQDSVKELVPGVVYDLTPDDLEEIKNYIGFLKFKHTS